MNSETSTKNETSGSLDQNGNEKRARTRTKSSSVQSASEIEAMIFDNMYVLSLIIFTHILFIIIFQDVTIQKNQILLNFLKNYNWMDSRILFILLW